MQYLGGKSAIALKLAKFIADRHPNAERIVEPFCGGGNMTVELAKNFKQVIASDGHPDLIMMWRALKDGWRPPNDMSEQEYRSLKHANPSPLRGFAGFGCSYGGKWFGGFARSKGRNHVDESARGLVNDINIMDNVTFEHLQFKDCVVEKEDVVYCDPPYISTTGYLVSFNDFSFWATVRRWSKSGAHVYVSEYRAPMDFDRVWMSDVTGNMVKGKTNEGLYTFKGDRRFVCTT